MLSSEWRSSSPKHRKKFSICYQMLSQMTVTEWKGFSLFSPVRAISSYPITKVFQKEMQEHPFSAHEVKILRLKMTRPKSRRLSIYENREDSLFILVKIILVACFLWKNWIFFQTDDVLLCITLSKSAMSCHTNWIYFLLLFNLNCLERNTAILATFTFRYFLILQ